MSVEYSAIAAKLKAMYSKFLTRDDYEQLLERKSVNDICSYLKSTPGYGEVLEQVNEIFTEVRWKSCLNRKWLTNTSDYIISWTIQREPLWNFGLCAERLHF